MLGAQGVRLNAVDFDGDGWPDLVVRLGGNVGDDFPPLMPCAKDVDCGATAPAGSCFLPAGTCGRQRTWLLRNTHDHHFEDVTQKSGIRAMRSGDTAHGRPGEVFAFGDFNNDGFLDVYTGFAPDPTKPTTETSEILVNNGDGTFALGPSDSPLRVGKLDSPAGASFVDFDRDGLLDLWVVQNTNNGSPRQDRLYKGDGQGGFTDVTQSLGLTTLPWSTSLENLDKALGHSNGWAANACDLDGDGNPELLASSYGRAPNLLWKSAGPDGGFAFTNDSIASGYAFDQNQDWHDNESARCWCKLHPTDMGCPGVPPPQHIICNTDADAFRWSNATDQHPFRLGGNSGATNCADVDNDGDMDLVTSEIVHWDVGKSSDAAELLLNRGDGTFDRPGNDATGLARQHPVQFDEGIMTGSVFDFDNDGWDDIYFGNSDYPYAHGLLFHQDSPGHFEAVPIDQGIDHHRSHGSVVADFDRDGDLDIVVGHSFARCGLDKNDDSECYATQQVRFFENVIGDKGNFIQLTLTGGPNTNRAAIGARVTVKAGAITMTQDVGGGHGHYGNQDDLTLHFGLADACEAEVTIRWPDADLTTQSFKVPAGYRFTVTEGEAPKAVTTP